MLEFLKYRKSPVGRSFAPNGDLALETNCRFESKDRNLKYVKILIECLNGYKSAKDLFPGVAHPTANRVRDLCRLGYLERYVKRGDRVLKYYYRTTKLGKKAFGIG